MNSTANVVVGVLFSLGALTAMDLMERGAKYLVGKVKERKQLKAEEAAKA